MNYIEIHSIKDFTKQLFAGTAFDEYLLSEAIICTAATFTIDGRVHEDFVGEEGMKAAGYCEGLVPWGRVRPVCYEIIKGRKVPSQFRIVLKLPERLLDLFLAETGVQSMKDQISGLFMNISFKELQLSCTTGIALKSFSLDKTLEGLWDTYVEKVLKQYE